MADTFPIDTGSLARAELTRPVTRYTPSVAELARQAAAAEHLAQVAAGLHVPADEYERHGIELEWHHQLDDPPVPYSPYLTAGGAS